MSRPSPDPAGLGDARAADIEACRSLIRTGSRSFFTASLPPPRRVRDPAYALYAFCRLADDAVDETGQHLNEVAGIADLPFDCRPAIRAARALYAEIGHEVARRGLDSVSGRAVVALPRKLVLVTGAAATAPLTRRRQAQPALEEVRFLVEAVAGLGAGTMAEEDTVEWWHLGERIGRVTELF